MNDIATKLQMNSLVTGTQALRPEPAATGSLEANIKDTFVRGQTSATGLGIYAPGSINDDLPSEKPLDPAAQKDIKYINQTLQEYKNKGTLLFADHRSGFLYHANHLLPVPEVGDKLEGAFETLVRLNAYPFDNPKDAEKMLNNAPNYDSAEHHFGFTRSEQVVFQACFYTVGQMNTYHSFLEHCEKNELSYLVSGDNIMSVRFREFPVTTLINLVLAAEDPMKLPMTKNYAKAEELRDNYSASKAK